MSTTCPNCRRCVADGSLFCGACGGTLAASCADARTVAMSRASVQPRSPQRSALTDAQRQTLTERMSRFAGHTIAMQVPGMHHDSSQREHVFLLIDVSGSMCSRFQGAVTKQEAASRAAQALLQHKDPNDEIGIIAFDDRAMPLMSLRPLHRCRQRAMTILDEMPEGGGTDISVALKLASKSFNYRQQDVVCRVVLLTDGCGGNPRSIAAEMKARGVVIDTVGVGADAQRNDVDEALLKEIASTIQGQNRYRFLSGLDELVGHYTILAGKTAVR
jgi:Mg-chelatase subunit ChlD